MTRLDDLKRLLAEAEDAGPPWEVPDADGTIITADDNAFIIGGSLLSADLIVAAVNALRDLIAVAEAARCTRPLKGSAHLTCEMRDSESPWLWCDVCRALARLEKK